MCKTRQARMTACFGTQWRLSGLVIRLALPYGSLMQAAFGIRIATVLALAAVGCFHADAEAPGVPLCSQAGQEPQSNARLLNAVKDLHTKGDALKADQA